MVRCPFGTLGHGSLRMVATARLPIRRPRSAHVPRTGSRRGVHVREQPGHAHSQVRPRRRGVQPGVRDDGCSIAQHAHHRSVRIARLAPGQPTELEDAARRRVHVALEFPTSSKVPGVDREVALDGERVAARSSSSDSAVRAVAAITSASRETAVDSVRVVRVSPEPRRNGSTCAVVRTPDVENVGCALLVGPVGAHGLDEPMAFVEPLRARVGRERPEPESLRALTLGEPRRLPPMPRPVIVGRRRADQSRAR